MHTGSGVETTSIRLACSTRVVESCEGMLQQLNPQIAKEKEQTEKINKLEGKVSGIEGKIDKMMGWLQQTMSK